MSVQSINLEFGLDFDIYSIPVWIKDEGTGTITVMDANVVIYLRPYNNEGILEIDFSNVDIQIRDYYVDLKGQTDWGRAAQQSLNEFKSLFKRELKNLLAWRMAKSVEEALNTLLLAQQKQIKIKDQTLVMNTTLVGDPVFTFGDLGFPIDGSFIGQNTSIWSDIPVLPIYVENGGEEVQVQQIISERSLNSLLW